MTPQEARSIYYDKIIDVARKHNIKPWRLVRFKYSGCRQYFAEHPDFTDILSKEYEIEFSYLVLDGTPIFQGDVIYDHLGNKLIYNRPSDMCREKHICNLYNSAINHYYLEFNLFLSDPRITLKLTREDIIRILELMNIFNESVKIDDIENKLKGALNDKNSTI